MSLLDFIDKGINTYFANIPRRKPSHEKMQQVRLIAHRGAHSKQLKCIENTHAAFMRAIELGCWGIEMDIHATQDNRLVVNHDATLQRLWGRSEAINQLSFQNLRALVPEIPSLAEVIQAYHHQLHFFIELKSPFNAYEALQQDLAHLSPENDYHLVTLDEKIAEKLAESGFPRKAILLVAGHNNAGHFCELSLEKNYGGVLGHYLLLTDKKIQPLRDAEQKIGVGFVDSKYSIYRELNRDILWLFSNNAEVIAGEVKRGL